MQCGHGHSAPGSTRSTSPGRTLLVGTITSSTSASLLPPLLLPPGAAPGSSTRRLSAGISLARALRSDAARTYRSSESSSERARVDGVGRQQKKHASDSRILPGRGSRANARMHDACACAHGRGRSRRTFARASSARPSSTKASSITGSSRKPASKPSDGTAAAAAPTAKLVVLPMATSEFMLGAPAQRDLSPSSSRLRCRRHKRERERGGRERQAECVCVRARVRGGRVRDAGA